MELERPIFVLNRRSLSIELEKRKLVSRGRDRYLSRCSPKRESMKIHRLPKFSVMSWMMMHTDMSAFHLN